MNNENEKIERERLKKIAYNKLILEKVNKINEEMNKQYILDTKLYKRQLKRITKEADEAFLDLTGSMSSDEYNEMIKINNQKTTAVLELELEIKRASVKRELEYKESIRLVIAEVDSFKNKQKNLNRARNNERVKAGLRDGSIVKAERARIKKEIKTSSLKYRDDDNRLSQKFKNKLQPDFRKPKQG